MEQPCKQCQNKLGINTRSRSDAWAGWLRQKPKESRQSKTGKKAGVLYLFKHRDGRQIEATKRQFAKHAGLHETIAGRIAKGRMAVRLWTKAAGWSCCGELSEERQAAFVAWNNRHTMRVRKWPRGGDRGPLWSMSDQIVSLYKSGLGGKEICKRLSMRQGQLVTVLNIVKDRGVFERGRKPPGGKRLSVVNPKKNAAKECAKQMALAFNADQREWRKSIAIYERAPGRDRYGLIAIRKRENKIKARKNRRKHRHKDRPLRNLMKRFRGLFKRGKNYSIRQSDLIGCSPSFLRSHLENGFSAGQNWSNYGTVWHIDHITPCAAFNLMNKSEAMKCFHFTNLRPLDASENIKKSDLLPDGTRASDKRKSAA